MNAESRNKQTPLPKCLMAVAALLAFGAPQQANASTISWSSAFNDNLFDSTGAALGANYSFEIGSFGSFTPTYANLDQWAANWKVFDRAFDATPLDPLDPDTEGWNSQDQFFVGTVDHNADGTSSSPDAALTDVFAQNEVAFLWVYNSKSISPSSEWALLTDRNAFGNIDNEWRFPDPSDTTGSYNWSLIDADEPIMGGVNGVRGPGEYSGNPATFSIQTSVVPEPGSALFLLAAAARSLTGRRREA